MTSMIVSGITGSFTGRYDADKTLVAQTWPNGVTKTVTTDDTGDVRAASTTAHGLTWYSELDNKSLQSNGITW